MGPDRCYKFFHISFLIFHWYGISDQHIHIKIINLFFLLLCRSVSPRMWVLRTHAWSSLLSSLHLAPCLPWAGSPVTVEWLCGVFLITLTRSSVPWASPSPTWNGGKECRKAALSSGYLMECLQRPGGQLLSWVPCCYASFHVLILFNCFCFVF